MRETQSSYQHQTRHSSDTILTRRVRIASYTISRSPDIIRYQVRYQHSFWVLEELHDCSGFALSRAWGAACLGFGRPVEGQESAGSRVDHDISTLQCAAYKLSPRANPKSLRRANTKQSISTAANPCRHPKSLPIQPPTPKKCTKPLPSPSSSPSSSPSPSTSPRRSRK